MPEGDSTVDLFDGMNMPYLDMSRVESEGIVGFNDTQGILFNDMSPEDADYWASQIKPHAWSSKIFRSRGKVWMENLPIKYLSTRRDNILPPEMQKLLIKSMMSMGSDVEVQEIDSGHEPFLSRTDEVAQWIRKVARTDDLIATASQDAAHKTTST